VIVGLNQRISGDDIATSKIEEFVLESDEKDLNFVKSRCHHGCEKD
jgi:hypothetical protein